MLDSLWGVVLGENFGREGDLDKKKSFGILACFFKKKERFDFAEK
jgi:hypothetical protein